MKVKVVTSANTPKGYRVIGYRKLREFEDREFGKYYVILEGRPFEATRVDNDTYEV